MTMSKYDKEQFLYKKSYLKNRLQQDVMEDGIAYIPCKVQGINDIISKFSTKGCESLDPEFFDYITDFIDFVPLEDPVVLEIIGPKFTPEEKEIIKRTTDAEMDYLLGRTEKEILHKKRVFWAMMIGTVTSGIILTIAKKIASDVPLEFFYVLFWLFADALVRYLFIERIDFQKEKMRMGRLASMEIEFEENNT